MRFLGLALIGLGGLVTYWALGLDRANPVGNTTAGGSGFDPNSGGAGQGNSGGGGGRW